jgi:hypothetical protein
MTFKNHPVDIIIDSSINIVELMDLFETTFEVPFGFGSHVAVLIFFFLLWHANSRPLHDFLFQCIVINWWLISEESDLLLEVDNFNFSFISVALDFFDDFDVSFAPRCFQILQQLRNKKPLELLRISFIYSASLWLTFTPKQLIHMAVIGAQLIPLQSEEELVQANLQLHLVLVGHFLRTTASPSG